MRPDVDTSASGRTSPFADRSPVLERKDRLLRRLERELTAAIRSGRRDDRPGECRPDVGVSTITRIHEAVADLVEAETRQLRTTIEALTLLVHETERQVRDRDDELSLVRQVAEISTAHMGSPELYREILNFALDATGADNASIFLHDPESDELKLLAARGTRDEMPQASSFRRDAGVAGRVFSTRRPMFIPDVALSTQFESRSSQDWIGSLLCLPLEARGEAIGILNLSHHAPMFFAPEQERVFMILAHQVAMAVKNNLLYDRLRELNASLEQRVRERTAELAEALEYKAELLGMAAHDIRNPLAAIVNFAWAIGRALPEGVPADVVELADAIRDTADHAVRIVSDLLDAEKIDAGKLVLFRERVRLADALASTLELNRMLASRKNIHLVAEGFDSDCVVEADQKRIAQVLDNLLNNAMKFSHAGGTIRVVIRREGPWAVFEVADEGVGIAPEDLPRIFGRFEQARSARTRSHAGSGLGLAICKKIVEMHNGRITAESQPGAGATFRVYLPACEATVPTTDQSPPTPEPAKPG